MRSAIPEISRAVRTTAAAVVAIVAAAGACAGDGRTSPEDAEALPSIMAKRVVDHPIITPAMLPGDDGASINGPSLIRVPEWVQHRLGRYYLYFAHHEDDAIRMAYADQLEGPWTIHPGGVLGLSEQSALRGHIASPEAVIDEELAEIGGPLPLVLRFDREVKGDHQPAHFVVVRVHGR